ncbi:hypothetical protein [Belnapia rosea]|uniref:Uncharacterized protein n=1 Tax=Belnapia rosea TaxID=938405 RepID=A0A1G6YIL7_9PROT|nr:hypothetical protein [Belnapia rosea]SDD90218.1 hypothetical protein SAMN04487779_101479 [Belnapia rosea]
MAQATPINVRPARRPARHQDETMSVGTYLLQGTAFIGFILMLFVLAGFRG